MEWCRCAEVREVRSIAGVPGILLDGVDTLVQVFPEVMSRQAVHLTATWDRRQFPSWKVVGDGELVHQLSTCEPRGVALLMLLIVPEYVRLLLPLSKSTWVRYLLPI